MSKGSGRYGDSNFWTMPVNANGCRPWVYGLGIVGKLGIRDVRRGILAVSDDAGLHLRSHSLLVIGSGSKCGACGHQDYNRLQPKYGPAGLLRRRHDIITVEQENGYVFLSCLSLQY